MSASEARTQQSTAGGARATSAERSADGGEQRRPGEARAGQQRPAGGAGATTAEGRRAGAPAGSTQRRVRLSVSRIDPWSVLKLSFLLSVVIGIAVVVAAAALWTVLDAVGVYDSVNNVIGDFTGTGSVDVTTYVGFSQVVSAATVLAVVDVVLLTALSTLGAVVYNVASALVGGLRVTLTDD
ncbi:DUF3566 domain-containing protein [uncultured Pseudokineococcus sp.]|uniref:DUF3566 domain-containing protein n=1 Tax=uncultured Pseudokineococcus sp. TaxID=1642928 RepID=UPI002603BE41|nr:DUF3566 domain-containing protein [uncultured Pseudokineococcus sp.]